MRALGDIIDGRRRSLPEIPIELFGHRGLFERTFAPAGRQPDIDFLDLAKPAIANQLAGEAEVLVASLLASGLQNALRFLLRFDDALALIDREC